MTLSLLVNIDVDDLDAATTFYCSAFGLTVGRRLGPAVVELLGGTAPIYLLLKPADSPATPAGSARAYGRHWTPVHLDFVVDDIEQAKVRVLAAGAKLESDVSSAAWGKLALFADPFGHGFCLVEFSAAGYDAIAVSRDGLVDGKVRGARFDSGA